MANLGQQPHAAVVNFVRGDGAFELKNRLHPRTGIVDFRACPKHRIDHRAAEDLPHHRKDLTVHRLAFVDSAGDDLDEIIGRLRPAPELFQLRHGRAGHVDE